MLSLRQILFSVFSVIILLFLFYISYNLNENIANFKKPIFKDISEKEYSIEKVDGKFRELRKNNKESDLVINYLDYIDTIISYKGDLKIEKNNIKLKKGRFLIDIGNINKNYNILSESFSIKNNGAISLYVDNYGDKTYIASLDSLLEIELLDLENKEKVNTIYLYPNQYIVFNPTFNKQLKNSDLGRIKQFFSLKLLNEKILKNSRVSEEWKQNVLYGNYEEKKKIEDMFLYFYDLKNKNKQIVNDFIKREKIQVSGINIIEDYIYLFLNSKKKIVYYKNKILGNLGSVLKEGKLGKFFVEIEKDLDYLKKESSYDFEEMKNIILYYSSIFVETTDDLEAKMKVYSFLKKIKKEDFSFNKKHLLYIKKGFYNYNFDKENNIYEYVENFSKTEAKNIDKNKKIYFISFLNELILTGFEKKDINMENLMLVINTYTDLSIDYYSAIDETDKTKKIKIIETGIKNYDNILRQLAKKIKDNYFNGEKGGLILLKNKNNINISKKNIVNLRKNLQNIYNFLDKNYSLARKGIYYKKGERKKLDNYLLALEDYSIYRTKNDKKNKDFLYINKKKNNNKSKLEIEDFKKYLSRFNGLDLKNSRLKVRKLDYCYNPTIKNLVKKEGYDYCYEAKNIKINNKVSIDFILIPSEDNKIKNIVVDGKKKDIGYALDIQEEKFNSKKRENNNYSFKDFFLFTFTPEIYNKEKETFEINRKTGENPTIRSFKNTLFLGKNGSFNSVKGFLDIKYNNIKMTESEDEGKNTYDIKVENAKLKYKNGEKEYIGIFNSDYIYKKGGVVSSFKNPNIKFDGLLKGNPIIFVGIFSLENKNKDYNFENTLKKLTNIRGKNDKSLLNRINNVVSDIYNFSSETKIEIKYNRISEKISFRTKKLYISINGDILERILYNGKNILTKMDKMDNLSKYFNN